MENIILVLEGYVSKITGRDDISVEIKDDTVILGRKGKWHFYIIPDKCTMIGCLIDDDIELSNLLLKEAFNIYHIYEKLVKNETVR